MIKYRKMANAFATPKKTMRSPRWRPNYLKKQHLESSKGVRAPSGQNYPAITGSRRSEVVRLTWPEVRGSRLLLADNKTGPRTVWIGDEVRDLLSALPRLPKQKSVFQLDEDIDIIRSVSRIWRKVQDFAGLKHIWAL